MRPSSTPAPLPLLQAWQLTRMLALWGIHNQSLATTESTAKTLCRVYLGIGLGFLQPLFLLTALLLAQHSLGCARLASLPLQPYTSLSPGGAAHRCRPQRALVIASRNRRRTGETEVLYGRRGAHNLYRVSRQTAC